MSIYRAFIMCIGLIVVQCTNNTKDLVSHNIGNVEFTDLFHFESKRELPAKIPGVINSFNISPKGDFIFSDQSTQYGWLYKSDSDTWHTLIIDDCHPGIKNSPLYLVFSDKHIYMTNNYNWAGYRFNMDGSCGGIFDDRFMLPTSITGLDEGFIGFTNELGNHTPLISKFDSTGVSIYTVENITDPNPYYSYSVIIDRGFVAINDSILLVANVSSPKLHYFNHIKGEFINKEPTPVPSIFKTVNQMFDEERYKEVGFFHLNELGSHMYVSQISLASDSTVLFHVPYMLTEEDDLIILQNIKNGNYVYTGLSKDGYKSYFLNNSNLFVFDYENDNTIMIKYNVNPEMIKKLHNIPQ